jgi:zinc transporter ZupT
MKLACHAIVAEAAVAVVVLVVIEVVVRAVVVTAVVAVVGLVVLVVVMAVWINFSANWREANIIPIPKTSNDRNSPQNLLPIIFLLTASFMNLF